MNNKRSERERSTTVVVSFQEADDGPGPRWAWKAEGWYAQQNVHSPLIQRGTKRIGSRVLSGNQILDEPRRGKNSHASDLIRAGKQHLLARHQHKEEAGPKQHPFTHQQEKRRRVRPFDFSPP